MDTEPAPEPGPESVVELEREPESVAEPEPKSVAEPEPESVAEPEPESVIEPDLEPGREPLPKPDSEPKPPARQRTAPPTTRQRRGSLVVAALVAAIAAAAGFIFAPGIEQRAGEPGRPFPNCIDRTDLDLLSERMAAGARRTEGSVAEALESDRARSRDRTAVAR